MGDEWYSLGHLSDWRYVGIPYFSCFLLTLSLGSFYILPIIAANSATSFLGKARYDVLLGVANLLRRPTSDLNNFPIASQIVTQFIPMVTYLKSIMPIRLELFATPSTDQNSVNKEVDGWKVDCWDLESTDIAFDNIRIK
jgi:hypothetical protein